MSKLNTNTTYNDFTNKSFGLLRTNPKLTSNVKLVVDSNDAIYLSSFNASKELSSAEYKKFNIHSLGKYSADVSRFYKKLPMLDRYRVMREHPDLSVYSEYSKQYENQYNFGAEFNATKLYDEQYKFLAPLWLDTSVPKMFVVYRVEKPTYDISDLSESSNHKAQNERIMEMLKNSTIVKTFDLTRKSAVGKYIRNHVEDPDFPNAALSFDFNEGEPSVYHGIDLFNGGFASKEDYIYDDFIRIDGTEIDKNEIISGGFERNGMVYANIINMEFMFDDPYADKYKTYRYFGLYVDDIEEGSFEAYSPEKDSIGFKAGTVASVYDLTGLSISHDDMIPSLADFGLPTLNYITDKHGDFYHIKNRGVTLANNLPVEIHDSKLFDGFKKKKGTIRYSVGSRTFKSFIKLNIKAIPNHLDKIFIGNVYVIKEGYNATTGLPIVNMFDYVISADSSLAAGYSSGLSFSNQGGLSQVISALCDSIRYVTSEDQLKVTSTETAITIESFVAGPDRNMIMFGIYNNNISDFIEYNESKKNDVGLYNTIGNITFTDWDIRTMTGGAGKNQGLRIRSSDFKDVAVGDYLKIMNQQNYVKVSSISGDYSGRHNRVILEKGAEISNDGTCEVYTLFRPTFGKFSAYNMKDLSFDFHRDATSDIGELSKDLTSSTGGFGYTAGTKTEEEMVEYNLTKFYNINSNIIDDAETYRISNQYERLSENSLKEHALESRVVPYICEFELKGFSNIRGGKYILSANESMGRYNSSVDSSKLERDPHFGNLEYFDLSNVSYMHLIHQSSTYLTGQNRGPLITNNELINFKNNIIFAQDNSLRDVIDLAKIKSISYDYFSVFAEFNGYHSKWSPSFNLSDWYQIDEKWHDNERIIKYSTFDEDTVYHKGLKYIIDENSDEYKFMCVIDFEDDAYSMSSDIKVIKNEKFKKITAFIKVKYPSSLYRKAAITPGFMYTHSNIFNWSGGVISTPILSTFDFAGSTWSNISTPGEPCSFRASQASINDGSAKFLSQFTRNAEGEYSKIRFTIGSASYTVQVLDIVTDSELVIQGYPLIMSASWPFQSTGVYATTAPSFNGANATYIYEDGGSNAFEALMNNITANRLKERLIESDGVEYIRVKEDGTILLNDFKMSIEEPTMFVKPSELMTTSDTDKPSVFSMISGAVGKNIVDKTHKYYTTLKRFSGEYIPLTRDVVSFDSIYNKHKLNYSYRASILSDFTTSATTMAIVGGSDWTAVGSVVVGSEIIKYSAISYDASSGYSDLTVLAGQNAALIKGGIEIFFNRNLETNITVIDAREEQRERLIHGKFNGYGIAFESWKHNIKDYGLIKNMYFHKVNDDDAETIIKLSKDSEKQPLYPMVGEVAIDKKDFNIFDSKYTKGFFTKSFSGLENEKSHGTLSPVEEKSFMSSSIMRVDDEYSLDLFNSYKMKTVNDLEKIQNLGSNKYTIHWFEDDDRVYADFYLTNMVYDKLISDDIMANFQTSIIPSNSYGDKTTVADDLLEYIKHNITPRFIVNDVDVYVIESKDIVTSFVQDVSDIVGYKKSKSHSTEMFDKGKPGFRLIYAKRSGYNYSFKVNVKIKA